MRDELSKRHFCFLAFWMASVLVFHTPLTSVLALSLGDERYSHIPAIPLVSALLIYSKRRWIFRVRQWRPRLGAVLLAAAVPLAVLPRQVFFAKPDTALFSGVLAMILVWAAGFVFCYGTQAFRSALFSFSFLFLAVPLPTTWLDQIVFLGRPGFARRISFFPARRQYRDRQAMQRDQFQRGSFHRRTPVRLPIPSIHLEQGSADRGDGPSADCKERATHRYALLPCDLREPGLSLR
jgi:hypothetical protein